MDLLNFADHHDGGIKGGQSRFARVRQLHLDKGHVIEPEADRIHQRAISLDIAFVFQPFEPGLSRRF